MPHAVAPEDVQAENDDALINSLLSGDPTQSGLDFLNRDLEVGEKANDAEDFEDIGDDDIADEEEAETSSARNAAADQGDDELDGIFGEAQEGQADEDAFDDLFGDQPSSPTGPTAEESSEAIDKSQPISLPSTGRLMLPGSTPQPTQTDEVAIPSTEAHIEDAPSEDEEAEDEDDEDDEWLEQRALFAQARRQLDSKTVQPDVPAPPANDDELFEQIWHEFEPHKPPNFPRLLPPKRAFYIGKKPLKPPKPVHPTKVNLDLLPDQEKAFKLPGTATRTARQAENEGRGLIFIKETEQGEASSDDGMELEMLDHEEEPVGGVSWNDLNIICESWEIPSPSSLSDDEARQHSKRRRIDDALSTGQLPVYHEELPSFDDPEQMTSKLARKIILNLNDPQLLLDIQQPSTGEKRKRMAASDFSRDVSGSLTKSLARRFNISNDEAYDALKENHQHKVRSTLGTISVEHGLPALKLQYPFYKVKLEPRESRSFHRPQMLFKANERVHFSRMKKVKKEDRKGKSPQALFAEAKDLTLGDNAPTLLLEYSEEYPIMLSNLAMGSRLVNYYRRKDDEDTNRPKLDLGETQVLLPQDKSPFSIFGNVEPGEITPTLHNAMYRAPVFRHKPKPTDFLVCRSVTGIHGQSWYLKNIDNIMVVGQEFPSQEVPGTHSRKVTDASKKRLRMIAYRIWRKNKRREEQARKPLPPLLSNEMIRQHLPGSDIAQNRGKMREFMAYDKENGSWMPKQGEVIPDEEGMRNWIAPEDICLLDSMQVGSQHLQDAGYNKDLEEDENEEEGGSLEQQLAPWHTTKNFIHACERKAMLQLHGEGDPSGRGEAFSFIKTSMKGGFKPVGESIEDRLDAKRLKELGGHSYNVARQQKAYDEAIKRIWEAQARSLSATVEHSDVEMDVDNAEENENPFNRGRTPRSEFGTPAAFGHRDDESASQFSKFSSTSQKGKVLKITRRRTNPYGRPDEQSEVVTNPQVIREYVRRRRAIELQKMTTSLTDLKPTGDAEADAIRQKMLLDELARLERNKERRHVREKAKGIFKGDSTPATPMPGGAETPNSAARGAAGTQRRCANCGLVGHIKTNKKLCPMLNGTMNQPSSGFDDSAFGATGGIGSPSVAATPGTMGPPPAGSPQ